MQYISILYSKVTNRTPWRWDVIVYVCLLILIILTGYTIGSFGVHLTIDFSQSSAKKIIFLLSAIMLMGLLGIIIKNVVRAFIFLFPILISMNFVIVSVGINYEKFLANNYLGYRPWIYLYEPLIFVGLCFAALKNKRKLQWISAPVIYYSLFLLFCLFSVPFSINPFYSLIGLFSLGKYLVWVIVFLIIFSQEVKFVSALTWGFVVFTYLQAFVAILQAFHIQVLGDLVSFTIDDLISGGLLRVGGTLGRSDLESTLILILPILYSFGMSKVLSGLRRNLVVLSAVLGTVTLFLTGTRGPILSLALGLFVIFFISLRVGSQKNKLITALLIVIVSVIGGIIFLSSGDVTNTLYRTTYMDRLQGLQWGFSMFLYSPFVGIGINNYLIALPNFGGTATLSALMFGRTLHDQFALALAETGFLGFAAFLLFLNSLFKTCWKAVVVQRKINGRTWFPIGFLGSLVALTASSLADVPLVKNPIQIVLAMLTAAICLLAYWNRGKYGSR